MAQIEELCANPTSLSCSDEVHHIVMFLNRTEGLSKHVDSFMQMLSLVQLKETPPFVLTPLLPDEVHDPNFLRWYTLFNYLVLLKILMMFLLYIRTL